MVLKFDLFLSDVLHGKCSSTAKLKKNKKNQEILQKNQKNFTKDAKKRMRYTEEDA